MSVRNLVALLCLVGIMALTSCAITSGSTFSSAFMAEAVATEDESDGSPPSDTSEEVPHRLEIVTDPANAQVYLDGDYLGKSPVFLDELGTGTYRLRIEKDGYYTESRWIDIPRTGTVRIETELELITGFVDVQTSPMGAEVRVDGALVDDGFAEVPIGMRRVTVEKFGFRTQNIDVRVSEQEVSRVRVELEAEPFAVSGLTLGRPRFNPSNPGATGSTTVRFRVTAPGNGTLRVVSQNGAVIREVPLGQFTSWDQEYRWDGRDSAGQIVADGQYRIELELNGDDGRVDDRTLTAAVDSSLVVTYRSIWSSSPGLLYAPTLSPLPAGQFQLALQAGGIITVVDDSIVSRFPGRIGLRAGLGSGMEIAFYGGMIAHSQPVNNRWAAGGSLSWSGLEVPLGAGDELSVGVTAGGMYQSPSSGGLYASPDTQANPPGMFVGFPVQATLGPVGFVIAPQYHLSPAPVFYYQGESELPDNSWGAHGYLKGGVYAEFGSLVLGASAAVRSQRFAEGIGIDLPLQAGAEIHWVIPNTSVGITGFVAAEASSFSDFYMFSGLGVGFLF